MEWSRGPLVEKVSAVLYRHDPMGLAAIGCPSDEYDPEAREFADLIEESGGLTGEQVNSVWRYFFDTVAGPPEVADRIAADIRAVRG